jgi:hypothetical protein
MQDDKMQVDGMAQVVKLLTAQDKLLRQIIRKLDDLARPASPPRYPPPRKRPPPKRPPRKRPPRSG